MGRSHEKVEAWIQKRPICNDVEFYLFQRTENGTRDAKRIELREPIGEVVAHADLEPTFRVSQNHCQELMDQLWSVGFRPSEGTGSAGALKQAEEHIKSLRQVAHALVE